jgi:glutathione S-transferase
MRLHMSALSPFVRKCRVVIREKGLSDRVEEVVEVFPYKGADYGRINPLGQVPALELDDGEVLTNSPVIADYLDRLSGAPRLLPADGPEHWAARRREVLGDQISEMAVKLLLEGRRPETQRSAQWTGWWSDGLIRVLDAAEAAAPEPDTLDLGTIAMVVGATYLEFRHPQVDWRAGRPRLAALNAALEKRPSFVETFPRE